MTTRTCCSIGTTLVVLLVAAGWLGWRWYTTPQLPDLPLERMEADVAQEVREAMEAVRSAPRSAEAWGRLGMTLGANRHQDQAMECFAHAEQFAPRDPRWPYLRGTRLLVDDREQGIPLMDKALSLATLPEHRATIAYELAAAHIRDGELEEADKYLSIIDAIAPQDPRAQLGHGLVAAARGDDEDARRYLTPLTATPFARKRASSVLAALPGGDPATQASLQQQAGQLPADLDWPNPFDLEVQQYQRNRIGLMTAIGKLDAQGRHPEARDRLRQMAVDMPHPSVYQALGAIHLKLGELDDAEAVMRMAAKTDPDNSEVHGVLGIVLFRQGEKRREQNGKQEQARELFAQALAEEDRALVLNPESPLALLFQGHIHKALGHTDEAFKAFKNAILAKPDLVDAYLELGEMSAAAGRTAEARAYFTDAQRVAPAGDTRPQQALQKLASRD
jgi:tetratricopeptide (TPR) repeat protein